MEEQLIKVRCFEPGSHPAAGPWRQNEVCRLPLGLARALIDAKAGEAVDEDVPTTKPEPKQKVAPRRAVAPKAEEAVEAEEPDEPVRAGKAEKDEARPARRSAPPVPPPAPGTRK